MNFIQIEWTGDEDSVAYLGDMVAGAARSQRTNEEQVNRQFIEMVHAILLLSPFRISEK